MRRLRAAGVASPVPEARALLTHALGLTWAELILGSGRPLSPAGWAAAEALARRREAREPLQHLLDELEWGGVKLRLRPGVLIPRPETEWLLHLGLEATRGLLSPRVLDVGTGSGAIALGFKAAQPDAEVTATDLNPEALALARENAERLGLEIGFQQADLLQGITESYDLIVSNPPYLPASDAQSALPELRHDPPLALFAGPDGLDLARRLAAQAPAHLRPGGRLLLELDPRNVGVLAAELAAGGWRAEVFSDLIGRPRFLRAGTAEG